MRLLWKLSLIVALGIAVQLFVGASIDNVDEVQFESQVLSNTICGHPTDTEIAAAADRMRDRIQSRHLGGPAVRNLLPPPGAGHWVQSDDDPV